MARKAGSSRAERQATLAFCLFVAPLMIGLAVFVFVPIIWGFMLSFTPARYTVAFQSFVGLRNYVEILQNPAFVRSLVTGVLFVLFIVPTTYSLSLILALLVNEARRGAAFFRIAFFLPTACSYVLASMIWRYSIFNGMFFGLANTVLYYLGIDPILWTNDLPWIWVVLVTVRLWLQAGFYMILFLAALQNIPEELYEAARVDGAGNKWQEFVSITFPLLGNTSVFVIILNVIHGFMAFDEFYNILAGTYAIGGSLLFLVRPPLVFLYQSALSSLDFGLGSAGSFVLTALMVIVALIQGKLLGFGQSIRS